MLRTEKSITVEREVSHRRLCETKIRGERTQCVCVNVNIGIAEGYALNQLQAAERLSRYNMNIAKHNS